MTRTIRAARGNALSCKGWVQEAALRMLMNNLDPEVAERPHDLVVYGGRGKAARDWGAYETICRSLTTLGDDETLLVQSGKPVGILETHPDAPRVLIANANLVGRWATWDHFWELEKKGLMMFGQMTAGSWIYIGSQGIVQGTFETFAQAGRTHFGSDDLTGRLILSAGLGGMGGAQPLAATMAGAVFLGAEVDRARAERRLANRYLDVIADDLEAALALCEEARRTRRPLSVAIIGNAADVFEAVARQGVGPDLVTDQTSAHDPLNGYVPQGLTLEEAANLRTANPEEHVRRAKASMAVQVRAMLDLKRQGSHVFDYGNNIRAMARDGGEGRAFDIEGFVPLYIRPMFCQGLGPFRYVALSGDPADIAAADRAIARLFPEKQGLLRWLALAQERVAFQGLPARICWLGMGEREKAGLAFNELVRKGVANAPIVIGRDHLDCGSVASPYRETEGMKDGSDAVADWPILNALVNAVNGASWVSFHHGGGVGIGHSLHAGQVIVADGTDAAARRLSRVLRSDPAMGILRHADAGYPEAVDVARARGVKIPGVTC